MIDPTYRRMARPFFIAIAAALAAPALLAAPRTADAAEAAQRTTYILFDAGTQSSMMSGSMRNLNRALALRSGREGLLYFRESGRAYVIRDAATLAEAKAIFAPQEALGAKQAALGSKQAALGQRQAKLGLEQGRLGRQQADATPSRAEELARQQDALGKQQDVLGREQDALGEQQDVLGREQDRLATIAEGKIRTLVQDAIQRGVAQPVK